MKEYKKLTIFLICVVSLKIAFAFIAGHYSYFALPDLFASVLSTKNIVSLTNESREASGLNKLEISRELELAAQKKAEDMLENQYFSHVSPSGREAWNFMNEAGYNYIFAGENLAMNFNSAEDVNEGWLASLLHKENILDDRYTQIGIGIVTGEFLGSKTTIIVQMFGRQLKSKTPIRSRELISSASPMAKRDLAPEHSPVITIREFSMPEVKGAPIEKYISDLGQKNAAQWIPSAEMNQLYAPPDTMISTKNLLHILFIYFVACGAGIFAWRFFKEKYYRNRALSAYAAFVVTASLILIII